MTDKQDLNIRSGVSPALHRSEEVLTYLFASARGHQQSRSGGVGGMVGARRSGGAARDAASAGITLASPMAFVLTRARLITVQVGNAGTVEKVLDTFDLSEIGEMTVKRFGLGASVTLEIRGAEVKLESRIGASRAFAECLDAVRRSS